jgi:hypothetical protein
VKLTNALPAAHDPDARRVVQRKAASAFGKMPVSIVHAVLSNEALPVSRPV